MKRINTFRQLLFVSVMGVSAAANAQVKAISYPAHPLGTGTTASNFYGHDYVGTRLEVLNPASVAGDKGYTITNDGTTPVPTGAWALAVTTPIVNKPIIMLTGPGADSLVTTSTSTGPFAVGAMAGKVAVVYRGGGIEFGHKAKYCANAGALAVIIVNNVPGGPVGMAAGTEGPAAGTGCPVFMISKADGDALDYEYNLGNIANVTITPWGQLLTNDLGFIPGGLALGANYATPADQMTDATTNAYFGADGAFVGNFGTADQSNVVLKSTLTFNPTTGGSSTIHTSTVGLASFPVADSIYAMFDVSSTSDNVYGITAPGTGRFDLKYEISQAATDDYAGDNTATVSYYASDSVYSKGRYDFTNNKPFINSATRPGGTPAPDFLWGPMYYVNKGGASISKIQYRLYNSSTATPPIFDEAGSNVLVFKWNDGSVAKDSVVQDGELQLVAWGVKNFSTSAGTGDTSGADITVTGISTDTSGHNPALFYKLEDATWYYVAVDVPTNSSLGIDGIGSGYPRIFARAYNRNSFYEYNNMLIDHTGGLYTDFYGKGFANFPQPFTQVASLGSVDSFNYDQSRGIIPQVAMTVNKNPGTIDPHILVKNVSAPTINASIYPVPATNSITVSLDLDKASDVVTYTIIDGLARVVSKESTYNVKSDKHTINTSKLASGNYYLMINANGIVVPRKFTIVK